MRTACTLWGLLYLLFVARIFATPTRLGVYPIFALAARRWWEGVGMYVPADGFELFRYSPTFSVGFAPFGLLPDPLGVALWNLWSLAILFAALRVLVDRIFPWTWTARQEGIFLTLTVLGIARGFWSAQTNALLFALAVLGVAALLDKRWWTAAFLLALPIYIKIWPIGLVMLLCARWGRPLLLRSIAAIVALAAVPFLTRPWGEVVSEYSGFLNVQLLTAPMRWPGYRDLWTILEQFGTPDFGLYAMARAVTAGGVFAWCIWQARRLPTDRHLATAILAIWAAWQLLIGPGTERLTYGLVAPFASAAILLSFETTRLRATSIAAWLMVVVLGSGAAERALLPFLPFSPAIQPAGVVVFLFWLSLWNWRFPPLET